MGESVSYKQSVEAGTQVDEGTVVTIYFKSNVGVNDWRRIKTAPCAEIKTAPCAEIKTAPCAEIKTAIQSVQRARLLMMH